LLLLIGPQKLLQPQLLPVYAASTGWVWRKGTPLATLSWHQQDTHMGDMVKGFHHAQVMQGLQGPVA